MEKAKPIEVDSVSSAAKYMIEKSIEYANAQTHFLATVTLFMKDPADMNKITQITEARQKLTTAKNWYEMAKEKYEEVKGVELSQ